MFRCLSVIRGSQYDCLRFYSVQKVAVLNSVDISKTRNVGIIAHIDAGKTTVTERLLFLSGATRSMGDVDSGSTVTDFLDIERERGITVQSAAISFPWKNHKINLVDTPGHVDFTVEVERCARVLDGVVTVLDSSAGVQAQTLTVWRQAAKFGLPAVFYLNKMDKSGANFDKSLKSMEIRLGIKGLVTVAPIYSGTNLAGFIDVINNRTLDISSKQSKWRDMTDNDVFSDELHRWKEELCYTLSDFDSDFMVLFLDELEGSVQRVDHTTLMDAIRRVTHSRKCAPVACGSALRSTESVIPVLNQIVDFLPSPAASVDRIEKVFGSDLSSLAFKVTHDKRKGRLSYVRVYTGQLKNNTSVFNSNRNVSDGPVKLFIAHGDELLPTSVVSAGDIAVVSGLHNTVTGDTLVASETSHKRAISSMVESKKISDRSSNFVDVCSDGRNLAFRGIDIPEPVYFCSVEPPTTASIHEFERALEELVIEDPSMRVRKDVETGQTVIETMGELHLEVIKDKFTRQYGLPVFIGPLQIGYREIVTSPIEHSATVSDSQLQGEKARTHSASVTFLVEPVPGIGAFKSVLVDLPPGTHPVRYEWQKALSEGCSNALHNGPVLGFPLQDVSITLKSLLASGGRVNPAILSACAHKCLSEALALSGAQLVEPIMRLEITLEGGDGAQPILQELARRRAQIESCDGIVGRGTLIIARMPLAEMEGLSSVVRILSSGLGSLHVEVTDYSTVSDHDLVHIQSSIRGH